MLAFGNVTPRMSCARLLAGASAIPPVDVAAAVAVAGPVRVGNAIVPTSEEPSSDGPAGYLPLRRMNAARSTACGRDRLSGSPGGIVCSILFTRSASERALHTERNPSPV